MLFTSPPWLLTLLLFSSDSRHGELGNNELCLISILLKSFAEVSTLGIFTNLVCLEFIFDSGI